MPLPSDLNNLDEAKPDGSVIPVAQLDNYQREHREFFKGWAAIEHSYLGRHAFPSGPTSGRPTSPAPGPGSIYFNTDILGVELFNGTTWVSFTGGGTPTGAIIAYGGVAAPTGWLICNGAAVSRTTFALLFAVVGTAYGPGDGSTTFNLPDMRGRVPAGLDGTAEFVTLGHGGGEKTHVLTVPEIPAHDHVESHLHSIAISNQVGVVGAGTSAAEQPGGATSTDSQSTGNTLTGGDGAHNNLQPYMTTNFLIKT